ncbi:hypothetical protein BBW65_01265 [Helicobacter enhydrae]|uniref:Uncharacterized protein n=1 Tax=Helicobacter enhydrae TaxID=222136 RepID=A0A1B1U432_9HELI|nr:hypothetical protein BBW65_01265 [Helicobacter enhydrae]
MGCLSKIHNTDLFLDDFLQNLDDLQNKIAIIHTLLIYEITICNIGYNPLIIDFAQYFLAIL